MAKKYKCPYCDNSFERAKLISHIDNKHADLIPEGYTAARIVFDKVNHNTEGHGICRVCKRPTSWSEKTGRYNVLCNNPLCRQKMRDEYKKNMLRVKGTYNILNDPEQQKLMLSHRKISGVYNHSDGGKIAYTGTYEKSFLEFIDTVMQIPSKDIISPGPTLEYEYNGKKHFYIADFLYLPYNLIIEIKDGGSNPNMQHSVGRDSSREKTIEKERVITNRGEYNYLRLTNNQFQQFIEVIMDIKQKIMEGIEDKTIRVNESFVDEEDYITSQYIIESNVSEDIKSIKTPEELYKFVISNITYKHNNKFNTPEDVLKTKSGDCHDQAYLLYRILKSLKYECGRIFMIEYNENSDKGGKTHTACWYKDGDKYKYIETAWGKLHGIHGPFDSINEIKKFIKDKWDYGNGFDKLYMKSTTVKPPMSFKNYVDENTSSNN